MSLAQGIIHIPIGLSSCMIERNLLLSSGNLSSKLSDSNLLLAYVVQDLDDVSASSCSKRVMKLRNEIIYIFWILSHLLPPYIALLVRRTFRLFGRSGLKDSIQKNRWPEEY